MGTSFEEGGRDEPGCEYEGEWYFSGRGGGWNESFGLGGSGREATEGLAYIVSSVQRILEVVTQVVLVAWRVNEVELEGRSVQVETNNPFVDSVHNGGQRNTDNGEQTVQTAIDSCYCQLLRLLLTSPSRPHRSLWLWLGLAL